jgi:hypothetical protein
MKLLKSIASKIELINNRRKSFIRLSFEKKYPKLIVAEKYQHVVKWILRIVTIIGVIVSVFSLTLLWSLTIAILLLLIEQFFEKAIFEYTTMYIQPLPNFKYEPEEWRANIFVCDNVTKLYIIGIAFNTKEYAEKFFELLKSWNCGLDEDFDNNICLSFIIESDNTYSTYVYPNDRRRIIGEARRKVEGDLALEKYGKCHQQLIVGCILKNTFEYNSNSSFITFKNGYMEGNLYRFQAFLFNDGSIEPIEEINFIVKKNLKIKNRNELSNDEMEYIHGNITND